MMVLMKKKSFLPRTRALINGTEKYDGFMLINALHTVFNSTKNDYPFLSKNKYTFIYEI